MSLSFAEGVICPLQKRAQQNQGDQLLSSIPQKPLI